MSKARHEIRPRLGRGLSSLIPVDTFTEPPSVEVTKEQTGKEHLQPVSTLDVSDSLQASPSGQAVLDLPLDIIDPNPNQPRRHFDEAALVELAGSMKANGVIQPIIVRKAGTRYQVVAGERRWRAAHLAGMTTIPAIERDIAGMTQFQVALVENIHRQDLNPMERAQAYRSLLDELGLTQAELATRVGEDRSSVANYVRLLDLAPPVREMVSKGELSLGHAKILAGLNDPVEQERLAKLVTGQALSVRNLELAVAQAAVPVQRAAPTPQSAHIVDLERNISRQLGLRVQIRSGTTKGRGRLIIHYASLDQFDDLLARMQVSVE